MKLRAPCGSWASPLSAAAATGAQRRYSQPRIAADGCYWLESRPQDQGRVVLVHVGADGTPRDVTPPPYSVRDRVHEYGGGAYAVTDGEIYFCNDADQCIYRVRAGAVTRLTEPSLRRYADLVTDAPRRRLICICEEHGGGRPRNVLAAISLDDGSLTVLADNHDFFSSPALAPDGRSLAWLSWDAPQMPWDGTHLWLAACEGPVLKAPRAIAGGATESVFQPRFSSEAVLHYVSDRSGYWNIYRHTDGMSRNLTPEAADYGFAQWNCGMSSYGFVAPRRLVAARISQGRAKAVHLDVNTGTLTPLLTGCSHIEHLDAAMGRCMLVGGGPDLAVTVLGGPTQSIRALREPGFRLDTEFRSDPEALDYPTSGGERAKAWYYPPRHRDLDLPLGERPPLIVRCHGGPTSMNGDALDPRIQFWTSRGFAVADVNYRGSTGFGRAYRKSLDGQWGVKDVDDAVNVLTHLAARALVDPARAAVSGSSAGGFTALAALAFRDVFRAGSVHYGISELESAMTGTHKFEAHYGASLLGPWPAYRELYHARSPLYAADRIRAPVIFFQGLKDTVVPPEQSARMLAALRARHVPSTCLTFPDEGHGFRRAGTLERVLATELAFYSRVFGLKPPEPLAPLDLGDPA